MKNVITISLGVVIATCLFYSSCSSPTPPDIPINLNNDKACVMGIFDALGDELNIDEVEDEQDEQAFNTLIDVHSVIVEATDKSMGHPIHEIEDMDNFGTNLGVEVEEIAPDASQPLSGKQKSKLAKLFKNKSKEIK